MEIVNRSSARAHLIVDEEARAVIAYPALRVGLAPRRANTAPVLFIGPGRRQPTVDRGHRRPHRPHVVEVFHATMLRSGLITRLGLDSSVDRDYGPQRA
ncbi:hypothetical protein [Mycobacterium sp. AZCC_0083]|uniref:hypothetical protein n=1 Tax=Mycobacterium sp. AZCC_0083 TaxID=2735882 RepID=UPI00161D60BE|nr:hypothetical protein [Mycobacterium sp. AZCC_0083]MBB5168256.1 hypothetical protein [Mycobacterium sp. AZCC_0083]